MAQRAARRAARRAGCPPWYLRAEPRQAAPEAWGTFPHRWPRRQRWGGGPLAASAGPRMPGAGPRRQAPARRRDCLSHGLPGYSWTSDQGTPYGTQVGPATRRAAPSVRAAMWAHTPAVSRVEPPTAPAGDLEIVFARFAL
jgi:hypothetical protein